MSSPNLDTLNEYSEFFKNNNIDQQNVDVFCNQLILKRSKLNLGSFSKINEDEDKICIICLESFKKGLYKRTLKCNHTFHKKCVDKWIKNYEKKCPICREFI